MSNPPLTVALYCRVSSEEQAQAGTIQNQIEFARKYADLHSLAILHTYTDEAVSATIHPEKRLAGRCMLADAKGGMFNLLLVYRLDRLSRKLAHLLDVYEQLSSWGVSVRSMTEPLDTSSPVGRFVFQLLGSIAELERETITERMNLGRERALSEGRIIGRAPTGYILADDGKLMLDPAEAPLVREIFAMAANGTPAGTIARALNDRGVPPLWTGRNYQSQKGKLGIWHHTTVLQVLHNATYSTGEWTYHRRKNGTVFHVQVPAIVDRATALRAERQLEANNLAAKRPHRVYLLSGLIRCGGGHDVAWVGTGSRNPNRYYYHCRKGKECRLPVVRADLLDAEVWRDIRHVAENPGALAAKIAERLSESHEAIEQTRRELEQVEIEYQAMTQERVQAMIMKDRGEIGSAELSAYLRAGVGRVNELEALRRDLGERLALHQLQENTMLSTEAVCRHLKALVDEAEGDDTLKQKLVHALVNKVTVNRGEDGPVVEIEYLVSFDGPSPDGSTPDTSSQQYGWCTTISTLAYRKCAVCGAAVFSERSPRCERCQLQYDREHKREHKRRQLGYSPALACVDCGAAIAEPGRNRVRCEPCRKERERAFGREAARRKRARRKECTAN